MDTNSLAHLLLTVTNLDRARAFYRDMLGFSVTDAPDFLGGAFRFTVGGVNVWIVTHPQTPPGDRFSEFRVGLDHLAFAAPDKAALHDLAARLDAAGVSHSGVQVYAPSRKQYVVFRDPDNIQLEYWLNAPSEE